MRVSKAQQQSLLPLSVTSWEDMMLLCGWSSNTKLVIRTTTATHENKRQYIILPEEAPACLQRSHVLG